MIGCSALCIRSKRFQFKYKDQVKRNMIFTKPEININQKEELTQRLQTGRNFNNEEEIVMKKEELILDDD